MSLTVANQLYVDLQVNGTEIPLTIESIHRFEMIENIAAKLPTIEFEINDPFNYFHDMTQLVDGAILTASLHSNNPNDPGPATSTNYIVMGTTASLNGAALYYLCNGIYNAPNYLGGNVKGSYPGTSASVINTLTGIAGLSSGDTDSTNDSMNWIPSRETYYDFIKNIADHGYVDASSIMSHGVTDQGSLIYKNLTTLATASPSAIVKSGSPDQIIQGFIPCIGYSITSMAGLANFTYNYGLKLVQEKLTGAAQIFSDYNATMFSNFVNMSSVIKGAVSNLVRSEYLPHDLENQHQNYFTAEYANRRGKQLFVIKATFTTGNSSGINLYDVINFQPILPTNNAISNLFSGNYIVTAKKKFISNRSYYETIECMSQGFGINAGNLTS